MSNSIDTKIVSKLAEILNRNGLSALEYETENCRVSLSKSCCSQPVSAQPVAQLIETPVVSAPAPVAAPEKEDDISSLAGCVKSPMVGVVYLSSDPGSPNYVKIGDMVSQGDTVCLIEAMKTFSNMIKSRF